MVPSLVSNKSSAKNPFAIVFAIQSTMNAVVIVNTRTLKEPLEFVFLEFVIFFSCLAK